MRPDGQPFISFADLMAKSVEASSVAVQEAARAEQEAARARRLAAKLAALGVDPDADL